MNKYQRFRQGLKDLTPVQLLQAKATGSIWGAIGLTIAFFGMVYNMVAKEFTYVQLGFSVFIIVLIVMQVIQYISTKQQIDLVKGTEQINNDIEKLDKLGL